MLHTKFPPASAAGFDAIYLFHTAFRFPPRMDDFDAEITYFIISLMHERRDTFMLLIFMFSAKMRGYAFRPKYDSSLAAFIVVATLLTPFTPCIYRQSIQLLIALVIGRF
jgi:hypothetical protein